MTASDPGQDKFPNSGETANEVLLMASRFPAFDMPQDYMWPTKLHDPDVYAATQQTLPQIVDILSEPVQPATEEQVSGIFARNPHQRLRPWYRKEGEDGSYTYSSEAYNGPKNADGSYSIYYGINYTFDRNGRITTYETIEGEGSYDRGHPNYQEHYIYDDEGYLTQRSTWQRIMQPPVTDRFEYATGADGRKVPEKMTRIVRLQGDSAPMVVDLANYEEWLSQNPNGYRAATKEELEPKPLTISDFSVNERRRGILFADPEQLEHALVMYGDGTYPTPGAETALEHNDQAFAEATGSLGGALFSLMSRSGDMREFVSSRITSRVQDKWSQVQKSKAADATESVHFSFDYDGAGHFHKTGGDVTITKTGLELTLSAAYVGDEVEERLAGALAKKRGLRSASIDVPVNQTEREGYFLVDLRAACEQLGIPVTNDMVEDYLRKYLHENDDAPVDSYERRYGEQPKLFSNPETGVKVTLVTERHDYDTRTDLDNYFGHDKTAIWGPLPKEIRRTKEEGSTQPKLRIHVEPSGDPFDEETTQRTDDIVRSYMMKLQKG